MEQMEAAAGFSFDDINQSFMDSWGEGRVNLVADAAFAPTEHPPASETSSPSSANALAGKLATTYDFYGASYVRTNRHVAAI